MEPDRPSLLPLDLSRFIGREVEIAQITPLIVANRLVTLTGSGGAGKTRLAYEVASRLHPEFAEGVRLVEFSSLTDPALVLDSVAQALGIYDASGPITLERLSAYLEERELLLILDNCEHLLAACAGFAQALLRRCCLDLRILVTSREPLGVTGEVVWRVPPLATPSALDHVDAFDAVAPRDAVAQMDAVAQCDAVCLLVERAQTAAPGFALTPQNAPAVAEICRRLDGMPLAIELAAARVRILTVEQVAARLGDALDLLRGAGGAVPRHRTMRAAIEWSYQHLEHDMARALRRLAVFHGGWSLAAASETCDLSPADTLELMSQLIDKSLVVAEPEGGEMRYRLLETIRQYAAERLRESGEEEAACDRHLAHYLALSEAATPELRSPHLLQTLARLDREQDNIRAALSYALSRGDGSAIHAEQMLRLVNGLVLYWRIRSTFTEGRSWLAKTLALPHAQQLSPARACALMNAGLLALLQSGPLQALPLLQESAKISETLGAGDTLVRAEALRRLGVAQVFAGNVSAGRQSLAIALALFYARPDPLGVADTLWALGQAWTGFDDERARIFNEESLALYEKEGDSFMAARPRYELALLSHRHGDYQQARLLFDRCLADARQQGHRFGETTALFGLGSTARASGNTAAALNYLSQAVEVNRSLGVSSGPEAVEMGYAWLDRGDHAEAGSLFRAACDTFREAGEDTGIAAALVGLAHVRKELGELKSAAKLLGAAEAVSERVGVKIHWSDAPDCDRCVEALRRGLTKAALEAEWTAGKRMSLDAAIALGSLPLAGAVEANVPARALQTPLQAAKAKYGGLTTREREVAACVARGISNREIADELVLSDRTVEAHIGNILGKLNLSSRTQIATWALEKGLASLDRKSNRDV